MRPVKFRIRSRFDCSLVFSEGTSVVCAEPPRFRSNGLQKMSFDAAALINVSIHLRDHAHTVRALGRSKYAFATISFSSVFSAWPFRLLSRSMLRMPSKVVN